MFIDVTPAFLIASLFFIVSGCYLYLCVITLKTNTKSKARNDYLSGGVCLFIYSLSFGLLTITNPDNEVLCRVFWAIGFTSSCFFFSRWLVFSTNMITLKHNLIKQIFNVLSFVTLIICALCIVSNDTTFELTKYGIHFSYNNSIFFKIANIYLIIITIAFLVIFFRWFRESELKRDRIQALLFLILSASIAPIGFATDFIIPTFTDGMAIPLASICFLPVSWPLFLSIRKYKTLSITVSNASEYVFKTVSLPTLVLDRQNNIKLENAAALNFFGSSIVGNSIEDMFRFLEITPNHTFFDSGFENEKVSVETPSGTRICDMILSIEYDKHHDTLCKVALIKDITENERKDSMLREALVQANAASKAKSNFLSNMSHEIRTPMNAIIGMTTIGKSADSTEKKDYALNKISGASKHLLGVINDILDMSKIEADKLELSSASFEFEKMLQNVADVVCFRVDERKQKFYVNIGEDIPLAFIGDDQRLAQVLTNLLGNAIKFTPDEGTIRLDSQLITKNGDVCRLQISVEDTGIGISEEQIERLFLSFEQAEADTARKFGGTGLGLAISKRIVELMDGEIWVESEQGKGSKFVFTVALEQDIKREKKQPEYDSIWKNIHILVVDDDFETLDFFSTISAVRGITCKVASSGSEALKALETDDEYDICFIDSELPDIRGLELAKTIQAKTKKASVVMLCTSNDWQTIQDEADAASITKRLIRPLFPSLLADMINECMGISYMADQEIKNNHSIDFSDYSILLAEDIEINREIVLALLEPTSLNIDWAEDGMRAVALFTSNPDKYDLIFMDIQMPEMDGFEATRTIRALGNPYAKNIPIIAMTANVFREDIEKCLDVGMNGHVGKPLDFEEVIDQLRRYLRYPKKKEHK